METMNDYELLYLMSEQDEEAQKLLIKLYEQRLRGLYAKRYPAAAVSICAVMNFMILNQNVCCR